MNTTELKELAEKATPGPWSHEEIDPTDPEWGACEVFTEGTDTFVATHVCRVNDAAYIAAANPAEILELIAAHEDAQGEIRELRDRLVKVEAEHEALKKAISDAEPVAWLHKRDMGALTANEKWLARDNMRPFADACDIPLYTLEGIRTKP